jgi:hypothetical protein
MDFFLDLDLDLGFGLLDFLTFDFRFRVTGRVHSDFLDLGLDLGFGLSELLSQLLPALLVYQGTPLHFAHAYVHSASILQALC